LRSSIAEVTTMKTGTVRVFRFILFEDDLNNVFSISM